MLALHVGLALLMRRSSLIATLHGWGTLAVGLWIAFTSKDYRAVIPVTAYIMGAEILWRMTDAGVFWEMGKYAIIFIFGTTILRRSKIRSAAVPISYFLLLLPSTLLTLFELGLTKEARSTISFNLSGHLALTVIIIYFYQLKIKIEDLKPLIWSVIYPIIGILTLAVYSSLTATEIEFGSEAIFATSGGYGPNQVSAILSLGALLLIMLTIQVKNSFQRLLAFGLSALLLTQSLLTFSRGGVVNVAVGLALAFLHLLKRSMKYRGWILSILIFGLIIGFVIFPRLNQVTTGALEERFSNLDTTGRVDIGLVQLQLWQENFLLGVGPGMSYYRLVDYLGHHIAAHTEYTRILAEHGLLGALALVILAIMGLKAYFKAPDAQTRAWVVTFAAWSFVEMAHSAMRIVSISFILGLAMVGWENQQNLKSPRSIELKSTGPQEPL